MMNNAKRAMIYILTTAILTVGLAACNKVPENEIAKSTPVQGTPTVTVQATVDPEATETPQTSDIPGNSATPAPTTDGTAEPTETVDQSATPAPTATADPNVQTTADVTVTGNATAEPSATGNTTATQKPTATVKPSATKAPTKKPTATATPKKTPTATKKPTATKTPVKTATPKPTATEQKEVYQTITFEGKQYKVLMGRNGNPNLIKDYSTLPKVLQAYAYPTFDKEAVMMDVYKYAKSVGFTRFVNPNIPLLTESRVKEDYVIYPDAFVPGGNMTEELALEAFSWSSPTVFSYSGDSHFNAEYTELDEILLWQSSLKATAKRLADKGKVTLCLWVRDYGDSAYRKNDSYADGFYNGKYTKEYAMYFIYGGRTDLVQEVQI